MKCDKCDSEMLLLMTSYVCDRCNPAKGVSISVKEEDVAKNIWGVTIRNVDFCFNHSVFEITLPGHPNSIMFVRGAAREIYEYMLNNYDTDQPLRYSNVLEVTHVKGKKGERFLNILFPQYNSRRLFTCEEYVRLLRFMKPHVLDK